jgi:signal transduction histidine kinase
VALGPWAGGGAGVLMGVARLGATLANGVRTFDGGRALSITNSIVFYAIAGAVAGYVVALLRRAERETSAARAREELARTLHDGVLQTLAVVERRSGDESLARLAREQERELRAYLFGVSTRPAAAHDLGGALRAAAARFEDAFGGRVDVLVPDDVPALAPPVADALVGAVGEALTNAGKHGGAGRVTVYVEPTGDAGVFCSVKDDGRGFDPATTAPGIGLSKSIRGRMDDVGGHSEVVSEPAHGTEVRLWVP